MSLRKKGISEDETYRPCQHLLEYRSNYGARGFRMLQRCIRTRPLGRASLRKGQEVACALREAVMAVRDEDEPPLVWRHMCTMGHNHRGRAFISLCVDFDT